MLSCFDTQQLTRQDLSHRGVILLHIERLKLSLKLYNHIQVNDVKNSIEVNQNHCGKEKTLSIVLNERERERERERGTLYTRSIL